MPRYYPIALNIEGRLAVVVGGGVVARRKIEALLEGGAAVRVVAPETVSAVAALAEAGRVTLRRGAYEPSDLDGAFLAIAATDSPQVNARVAEDSRARGVLVNSADPPEVSDFLVAAGVRRGDLLLGIFTGGASPALARRIREQLEAQFGPEYGELAALLGRLRPRVAASGLDEGERTRVWRRILDDPEVLALLRDGRPSEAEQAALRHLP